MQVESFHATSAKQKQQIKWLYYKDKENFMITISAKNPNDEIYFIKDKSIHTIDAAIEKVMNF